MEVDGSTSTRLVGVVLKPPGGLYLKKLPLLIRCVVLVIVCQQTAPYDRTVRANSIFSDIYIIFN